jgi:hypothetical protein
VSERVLLRLDHILSILPKFGQGDPHTIFANSGVWQDEDAKRESWDSAVDWGVEKGFHRNGAWVDSFARHMTTLARPDVEMWGWFEQLREDGSTQSYSALAASKDNHTVLAMRQEDRIAVSIINSDHMAQVLVEQMAEVPPSREEPIVINKEEIELDRGAPLPPMNPYAKPGMRYRLFHISQKARTGRGFLYAAVRDGYGRSQHPCVLSTIDIAGDGRMYTIKGAPGSSIRMEPASDASLIRVLNKFKSELI